MAIITNLSLGSGSGSGEKNYILSGSKSQGWLVSGAGLTLATTTTAAELPDLSVGSAIKLTRVSGTDYAYYRFTLDQTDYNKKLKIQLSRIYTGTTGDYTIELWQNTTSAYNGTSTQLVVQSPSIPVGTGIFGTTADVTAVQYMELRIRGNTGVLPITLSSVVTGPGALSQANPMGQVESTTSYIIGATATPPTPGGSPLFYRRTTRDGEYAIVRWEYSHTSAGGGGSGSYLLPMPAGLTIDPSKSVLTLGNGANAVGQGAIQVNTLANTAYVFVESTTTVRIRFDNQGASGVSYANWGSTDGGLANASVILAVEARVPILQWAGSNTLNTGAGAQVEYAWNSGTWAAGNTDTVNYAYGPQGAAITGAVTNEQSKRVRFTTPIQVTDMLSMEFSQSRSGPWFGAADFQHNTLAAGVEQYDTAATGPNTSGFGLRLVAGSSTDILVVFGRGMSNEAFGQVQWPSDMFWRVKKVNPSSPVGFGLATATDSGLVSGGKVPSAKGAAIAYPNLGYSQVALQNTVVNAAVTGLTLNLVSVTLDPGKYLLNAQAVLFRNGATISNEMSCDLLVGGAGGIFGYSAVASYPNLSSNINTPMNLNGVIVDIAVQTVVTLRVTAQYSAGTPQWRGSVSAVLVG